MSRLTTGARQPASVRICVNLSISFITDWKMPGMTGDVLARQLLEGRPTLVVILMSGYDHVEEIVKTFDPTRVRFLRKPFNPVLLDETIRILLELPLKRR